MTQSQTGRSMIEMLGVLAIIGVLSVGGITGYSMAMRMKNANDLMDGASKFFIALSSVYQSGSNFAYQYTYPTDVGFASDNFDVPTAETVYFLSELAQKGFLQGQTHIRIEFEDDSDQAEGICEQMESSFNGNGAASCSKVFGKKHDEESSAPNKYFYRVIINTDKMGWGRVSGSTIPALY